MEGLLAQVEGPLDAVYGDKAYDAFDIHRAILDREARPVIPPRKGAAIHPPPRLENPPPTRGAAVARIAEIGRKQWEREPDTTAAPSPRPPCSATRPSSAPA